MGAIEKFSVGGKEVVDDEVITEVLDVQTELDRLSEEVLQIQVSDSDTYEFAAGQLNRVSALNKLVEGVIEPIRKKSYDYYKSVLDYKKDMLKPGEKAEKHLRGQMQSYMREQERIRQEEERKRLEAAQKEAERRAEEEFEKAVEEGDDLAAELAIESSKNVEVDTSDLDELTPDVDGISYRSNWKASLKDLRKLCLAVAKGEAPSHLVTFNQSEGNKLARSLKDELNVPGLEAVEEKVLVRR